MAKINDVEIYIEIDDKKIDYDSFLDDPIVGIPISSVCGWNGTAKEKDDIVGFTPTKRLYALAIEGTKGKEYWSINGLYNRGEWHDEDGKTVYKVWDRVI